MFRFPLLPVLALSLTLTAPAFAQDAGLVAQGKYIAQAGDCAACHTISGGKPFAGGYKFNMPMGLIVSSNITPSKQFGIGNWTEEQFARAVRKGVRPDGSHLYPAMPYPSYSKITDTDMKALYAYFKSVAPVNSAPAEKTALHFPFNLPGAMIGWDFLYGGGAPFTDDPDLTAEQNRGKYLAEGLGHCSTCHTPRNEMLAPKISAHLGGAVVDGWKAPNITSDKISGIGGWTTQEIATYLHTGHVEDKAQAGGPMADAVEHSFRHLKMSDLTAIAEYLKTVKPIRNKNQDQPAFSVDSAKPVNWTKFEPGEGKSNASDYRDSSSTDGHVLYNTACAACHGIDGQGSEDHFFPSLTHNTAVGASEPNNLVMAIIDGIHRQGADGTMVMPAFGEADQHIHDGLSNAQIAAITNFVTRQFGNGSANLTAADIDEIQAGAPQPWLIRNAGTLAIIGFIIGAIVIVLLVIAVILGFRRRRIA
ncbi:c-type cytochrome [Thioclava sp. BHET1]|nr:c-type cytochrome [Thioclava sp. BHET1]